MHHAMMPWPSCHGGHSICTAHHLYVGSAVLTFGTAIDLACISCAGGKELKKAADGPDPPMRVEWSENCVLQHDGWQFMFWDMPAALRLLQDHYPWFLGTFQSYSRRVQQGPVPCLISACNYEPTRTIIVLWQLIVAVR